MTGEIIVNCTNVREKITNDQELHYGKEFFCLNYDAFVEIASRSTNSVKMKKGIFSIAFLDILSINVITCIKINRSGNFLSYIFFTSI